MYFQLVYPIKVNGEEFYALIKKVDKDKYEITLYLGEKQLGETKQIKATSLKLLLLNVKHSMEKFFFTDLKKFVKEEIF